MQEACEHVLRRYHVILLSRGSVPCDVMVWQCDAVQQSEILRNFCMLYYIRRILNRPALFSVLITCKTYFHVCQLLRVAPKA